MKFLFILIIFYLNLFANNYQALLFSGNCVTCHHNTKSISAPSVVELKSRYKMAFPLKKDFVKNMSVWVQYPKKETSIMQDSISKYELMPELGFDLETLQQIAEYIYESDFTNENLN